MTTPPVNARARGAGAQMSPGKVQTVKAGVEPALTEAPPPRLLDRVRDAIRVRHFACVAAGSKRRSMRASVKGARRRR